MPEVRKPFILDMSLPDIQELLESWGQPEFRVIQIWQGLYKQLWHYPDEFTNLPVELRQRMD